MWGQMLVASEAEWTGITMRDCVYLLCFWTCTTQGFKHPFGTISRVVYPRGEQDLRLKDEDRRFPSSILLIADCRYEYEEPQE